MASEPEPAGGTEYAAYLLIDDLLRLQRPLTPDAHDELLFIIVHQAYELWFKLMLHELERVERELGAGRPQAALPGLKRIVAIDRLLVGHLDVLETLGPEEFLDFRDPLAPASGFQSRQFRAIEAASPPLYDAFCEGLGLPLGDERRDTRVAAMAAREIGSRPGTGGSRGVEYLRGTVERRFYPELWEVRVAL